MNAYPPGSSVMEPAYAWVFGCCGLVYFTPGAWAGMLADRFGPRRRRWQPWRRIGW